MSMYAKNPNSSYIHLYATRNKDEFWHASPVIELAPIVIEPVNFVCFCAFCKFTLFIKTLYDLCVTNNNFFFICFIRQQILKPQQILELNLQILMLL